MLPAVVERCKRMLLAGHRTPEPHQPAGASAVAYK
jgi:hypothetical protein